MAKTRKISVVDEPTKSGKERAGAATAGSDAIDSSYLEGLIGYNCRRAALTVIGVFFERMAVYALRPVDFSVLSLITHNPGVTSRQLCHTLGLLPPNLVGLIASLERRQLIQRRPHPRDGRAIGLHLTRAGSTLMRSAERTAAQLEDEFAHQLDPGEFETLLRLLKKLYINAPEPRKP